MPNGWPELARLLPCAALGLEYWRSLTFRASRANQRFWTSRLSSPRNRCLAFQTFPASLTPPAASSPSSIGSIREVCRRRMGYIRGNVLTHRRRAEPTGNAVFHLRADRDERRGLRARKSPPDDAARGPAGSGIPQLPRRGETESSAWGELGAARAPDVGLRSRRLPLRVSTERAVAGDAVHVHVPARRVVASIGEHALLVDLRATTSSTASAGSCLSSGTS